MNSQSPQGIGHADATTSRSRSLNHTLNHTLNCRMAFEPAALERLCQVVRIRGFRVAQMTVESIGDQLDIQLTLEGTRPIGMLKSQLEKLHTVMEVALCLPVAPDLPVREQRWSEYA